MSQTLQNVEVPGSNQRSVCKGKRVLALDQSSSEKVAKIILHKAGIQPCPLSGWGNDFPYPNYLPVLHRIAWGKQKSTYADIIAASSDAKKGCILQGNRSWITQQRTGKAQGYNTEQSWHWKKWKKNEGRWQKKKEIGKKPQLNGKVIQNRQDATSWKNDNIFIWGEISSQTNPIQIWVQGAE